MERREKREETKKVMKGERSDECVEKKEEVVEKR